MFRDLLQRIKGKRVPKIIDQREMDALIRENAEARGETLGRANKDESIRDKSIDTVSAPGVVGGPTHMISRTTEEHRARNKRSI